VVGKTLATWCAGRTGTTPGWAGWATSAGRAGGPVKEEERKEKGLRRIWAGKVFGSKMKREYNNLFSNLIQGLDFKSKGFKYFQTKF
jgi:hypothetical protein